VVMTPPSFEVSMPSGSSPISGTVNVRAWNRWRSNGRAGPQAS
jgi:hypothetical protein